MSGEFSQIGDLEMDGLTRWNGSSWLPIWETRLRGPAHDMLVHEGKIFVGNQVWDGNAWNIINQGSLLSLTMYKGHLVAGGYFDQPQIEWPGRIARGNGSSWQPFGSGIQIEQSSLGIFALAVWKGSLYVGGAFRQAGRKSSQFIARWDE